MKLRMASQPHHDLRTTGMDRRNLIALLGALPVASSISALAEETERKRRIGVLMNLAADHPEAALRLSAFRKAMESLGWSEGANIAMDVRWGENMPEIESRYAAELAVLGPDVFLAGGTLSVAAIKRENIGLPIVFAGVTDPVGAGFVDNLAHPGGNITGFMLFEFALSAKWLQLLKQVAPSVKRVAVLRNSSNPAGLAEFGAIQAAAQPLHVEVKLINIVAPAEIERAVAAFAAAPDGGLIMSGSVEVGNHRQIVALAARYKLPAIFTFAFEVRQGGLISYGPDRVDQYRRAAEYVDRILRGDQPADLPVQTPAKYELIINTKTAKALGLTIPATLLATADEVIE